MKINPVILIIMDGWGIAPPSPGNATTQAKTPNITSFLSSFPQTKLFASGESVGLPHGERGNSETGHLNLGAGRIVYQDLPRINLAIADGSFFKNQSFLKAIDYVNNNQSKLHLIGLIGQGGVHSNNEHLYALILLAKQKKVKNLYFHLFTDGRDSPPTSASSYIAQLEQKIKEFGLGEIATIGGRYYAMDRDNHWERTEKTYLSLVSGIGNVAGSAKEAIDKAYRLSLTDEFILPTIILNNHKIPVSLISDNDAVIFFNYRIDRPRQLTKAFILPDFENLKGKKTSFDPYTEKYYKKTYIEQPLFKTFRRKKILKNLCFVTMTEYERELPCLAAFPPLKVDLPLGRLLAENNLRQLHISETEKERFITYYFNGQREDPFSGEDRIEIPSPNVSTYDLKPEMSAQAITETVVNRLKLNLYDFILINFANPDMVGHTGVLEAGIKACEVVDACIGTIVKESLLRKATCLITADHGNVEEMINLSTGEIDTEHSTNPVPFICVSSALRGKNCFLPTGILADVAATVTKLLKIPKPTLFIGRNLLEGIKLI